MLDLLAPASALRVESIDADGVRCSDGRCRDRLASVGDLMPGDEALVCDPPGRLRGVVIGRIGAPRPAGPPSEVVIAASASLALRCGAASLTLRADGRALLAGVDLASRATRLNRITGAQVAIN